MLRAPSDRLNKWLAGRNGLDIVEEFAVRAEPAQWQEVLVRLTPRNYSISSSPLVSPHEVQLTVSVVRYRGAAALSAAGCARRFWPTAPTGAGAGVPAAVTALPAARGRRGADDHGRARHRDRAVPRASCRSAARSATPAATGCSSVSSAAPKTSTTETISRTWCATACSTGWTWRSHVIKPIASTSSTRCSTTAPTCGAGWTTARTSTCAGTPPDGARRRRRADRRSSRPTAACPTRPPTTTSANWSRQKRYVRDVY